jgi:hypothetical protein
MQFKLLVFCFDGKVLQFFELTKLGEIFLQRWCQNIQPIIIVRKWFRRKTHVVHFRFSNNYIFSNVNFLKKLHTLKC